MSPQHAGVTGKVENFVTWVFAAFVTASGQAWADSGMYMPDCRAKDAGRRRKAGIPGRLKFATKPDLAIAQLRRLAASGLQFFWVAADEVCGRSGLFRETCRELALAYVMIIPCDYRVTIAAGTSPVRADGMVNDAVFEYRSCGNGTKGPRYGDWAMIATARPREFLLIRRLDREKNRIPSTCAGHRKADLDVPRGDAPLPAYVGQPCPAGIPPVRLSDAESLRISNDTADYAAGLLSRVRLAFSRRWSRWRRRHQARARWHHHSSRIQGNGHLTRTGRKKVTPCNREAGNNSPR